MNQVVCERSDSTKNLYQSRVDQVYSRLSCRQYARKSVSRGKASDKKGKYKAIVDELEVIKKLSHRHLVKYIGSYTDKDYIAYLMEPIADCDLYNYLGRKAFDDSRQMNMQDFYGCLAGAINYIHQQRIRHADITSRNILVKSNRVYLSDFGAARDYSITGKSTTQHNVPFNIDYVAPEVVRQEARNRKSDMWSLGVVFLEITTVLRGHRLKSFWRHMEDQAHKTKRHSKSVQANLPAANMWLDKIRSRHNGRLEANEPIAWIKTLLEEDQKNRPSSKQLMSHIHSTPSFQHFCCLTCQDDFDRGDFEYENDSEHIPPKPRKERFGTDEVRASAEAMLINTRTVQTPMTDAKLTTIREWIGLPYEGSENSFIISPTQSTAMFSRDKTGSPPRHGSEYPLDTSSTSSGPSDKDYQSIDTDSSDDSSCRSRNDDRGEDSGRGYVIKTDPDSSDDSDMQQEPSSTIRGYHIISESESDSEHSYSGQNQSETFAEYFMSNLSETSESSSAVFHEAEEEFHSDKGVFLVDEVIVESETNALPMSTLTTTDDVSCKSLRGPEMSISLSRESSKVSGLTCVSHMLTRRNESRSAGAVKEISANHRQESPGRESRGLKEQYVQNYETKENAGSVLMIKDLETNAHDSSNDDEVAPGVRGIEIRTEDKGTLATVSVNEDEVIRLHYGSTGTGPRGDLPNSTGKPEAQALLVASTRTEPCSHLTRNFSPWEVEQNSNATVRIALPAASEETGEPVQDLSLLDTSLPLRAEIHGSYESPRDVLHTQSTAVIKPLDQIPTLYGDMTAIGSPWLGVAYGLQGQPSGNDETAKTELEEAGQAKKANHDIVHDHQPSVEGHEATSRKQKQPRLRKKEESLQTSQTVLSEAMATEVKDEGFQVSVSRIVLSKVI